MTENVALCILAFGGLVALAVVATVLALCIRRRSKEDSVLVAKLTDQLIVNSDYQIKRLEIEAEIATAHEKAKVASRYVETVAGSASNNGDLTNGDLPDFTTTPR